MSLWLTVLLASAIAFALKVAGYLVPHTWLDGPRVARMTSMLPVALLAALVAVQAFTTSGGTFVLDARAGAVAVALVALALRAPFLVVVVLAAATAAAPACARLGRLAPRGPAPGRARQARTAARYSRCSPWRSLRWRCCSACSRWPRHTSSPGPASAPECSCAIIDEPSRAKTTSAPDRRERDQRQEDDRDAQQDRHEPAVHDQQHPAPADRGAVEHQHDEQDQRGDLLARLVAHRHQASPR